MEKEGTNDIALKQKVAWTMTQNKKVEWAIENFSSLKTDEARYSEVFTVGGCAWKIALYRGRKYGKYLGIYLRVADVSSLPHGWSIHAVYRFTVVNQASKNNFERGDVNEKFCADVDGWGYSSFMELAKLQNPTNGYILNDKCVVEVEFFKVSSEDIQGEKAEVVPKDDGTIEFKGLGQIQKALVPLLEEAFLYHPSLMDCTQNRSRKFKEWAFTVLGRVLQSVKDKKWQDMNDDACDELQQMWEELEMSRLDLSWLEPLVKPAINMKGYLEKAMKVERLKHDLVVLETELNQLKENLANTEQSIEMTRKDLIKAEEGFEKKDLDLETEIGNGIYDKIEEKNLVNWLRQFVNN